VEPYSIHELMFPNPNRYLELLTGLAQFQAAIDLPQRSASDLVPLIRALFCWLPGSVEESALTFTLDNLVAFAEAFISATAGRQGPSILKRSDIESKVSTAIPTSVLSSLWGATVHEHGTVNLAFASPSDWRVATFVTKPFVSCGGEYIGLADQALGVESFLIAALKAVNSAIPGANDRVGRIGFETYVRQLLSAGGGSVITGKYGQAGQAGEIDALVETADAIILLECKKRMLGADALAGNRDEVAREMVLTVARGHEQLLRAECELLETGRLLIDGTSVYLSGREVFRIVVSLHDWGVLHDQQVVRYALTSLLSIQFGHHAIHDPAINKWITDVNEVAADLRKSITSIVAQRPERARQPFWNALFLPVGVLNLMLERRGDISRLARRLGTRSRLITGNLDAYADFEHLGEI
jgi:Holliday junction resolvase-like predicted endonuclease